MHDKIAETGRKLRKKDYERELERLQVELVKLQHWVQEKDLKVVIVFEGRDAAGKGGVIKRLIEPLNPRGYRLEALPKPTEKERGEWYFQRYVSRLPTEGEIVIFDRSWYNRAGVEKVMGFCTDEQYKDFLEACPKFEQMLVGSGVILIKYWFSVSEREQEERFQARNDDPTKRWKLSSIDLAARTKFREYTAARDRMFAATDTDIAPWYAIRSDSKRRARLNCISHFLTCIPYEDLIPEEVLFPDRIFSATNELRPIEKSKFVPEIF